MRRSLNSKERKRKNEERKLRKYRKSKKNERDLMKRERGRRWTRKNKSIGEELKKCLRENRKC
jgi:hypothetical protein